MGNTLLSPEEVERPLPGALPPPGVEQQVIGVALVVLIVQLAGLTNFLQNEGKPILISVISQAVLQSAAQAQQSCG
jgi:hypothetical protein